MAFSWAGKSTLGSTRRKLDFLAFIVLLGSEIVATSWGETVRSLLYDRLGHNGGLVNTDQQPSDAVVTTDRGTILKLWAVPGASRTEITGMHAGAIRVRVAAPAHQGAANRAIEVYLGKVLGTSVEILDGTARSKRAVVGAPAESVIEMLSEWIGR